MVFENSYRSYGVIADISYCGAGISFNKTCVVS